MIFRAIVSFKIATMEFRDKTLPWSPPPPIEIILLALAYFLFDKTYMNSPDIFQLNFLNFFIKKSKIKPVFFELDNK